MTRCRTLVSAGMMALLLALGAGCAGTLIAPSLQKPMEKGSTFLLHLPGMAGDTMFDRNWMNALAEGGAADHVELYDWTGDWPGVGALEAHDRNRVEAGQVARIIANRVSADAGGRIVLTGESAGTGIVVWALEKLPDDIQVDDVLLVAPAISPDYDLTAALRHIRGKLYYFSSPGDWYTLGMCTTVWGTMDGKNVSSAGYVGFHQPVGTDASQYAKLVEMKYNRTWIKWGNWGDHTGALSLPFARDFLAPLLAAGRPGPEEGAAALTADSISQSD